MGTYYIEWNKSERKTPISSVQFSGSVMSNSLQPHKSQHARLPCPSPTPRVHSDSHPSSQWCHPAISSSVVPDSFCPQSLPASESFPMSQLFAGGGFSFSIIPSKEHPRLISFRMDWLDLFAVQGTLKGLLQHHNSKASILWCSAFFVVQLSHPYMTTGKTIALTRWTFVDKVMSLLFNMLFRLGITFLPTSKCFVISAVMVHKCVREELPHVWGQGQKPGGPHARGAVAKRGYPTSEDGAAATSARLGQHRSSQEELPHAWGQGQRPGGATPHPRIGGCAGTGGPRGAIPCSRSGWAAVRRYPSSKNTYTAY